MLLQGVQRLAKPFQVHQLSSSYNSLCQPPKSANQLLFVYSASPVDMGLSCRCSTRFLVLLLLVTAIPLGLIISLERAPPTTHVYHYQSAGWLRESGKWDPHNHRFLVTFMEGGVGQIPVPNDHAAGTLLEEIPFIKDVDLAGNASLGVVVDQSRNRMLVVHADVIGNRYGALTAYDLSKGNRLFLTQLSGPNDEKSFAEDVAVDAEGNAYVTDAKGNKIWKVGVDGKFLTVIRSPLFTPKEWYRNLVGLNGMVHHPDGFLIVIHTFSGNLFKIELAKGKEEVKLIKVAGGPLTFGDGLELMTPTKLIVAGSPSGRCVESSDGWETASLVSIFSGLKHRVATAATLKDGKVYLSHLLGMGYPKKKHAFVEAVF